MKGDGKHIVPMTFILLGLEKSYLESGRVVKRLERIKLESLQAINIT